MKKFILCFFMLIASAGLLRADDISFQATVSANSVSLDEVLQLTLTATGVTDDLDPISLPTMDGFAAKYLGPSTSVSIINGAYHSERSFVYNLFPNKVGHYQIPAITATIKGHTYTTSPITIDVTATDQQAQPQASSAGASTDQDQGPSEETIKNDILLITSVDQHDVYLNQRVAVTIKLLVNGIPIRDIQYPQFDKTGMAVDDFDKPEQNSQVLNGVRYDTVVFKTYVYPNRLGDLTIGPVQIQANVLYKSHPENALNADASPFGADIFNGFLDSYTPRPVTIESKPVQLHVSELPDTNRPQDFSGAIGQFNFQASVAPTQVKAGDPLTLKMSIKGDGNFKSVKIPDFQADGFKTYTPIIKVVGDEKTSEEVIIPTSVDLKEVPALTFTYFDTSLKDYKTITQGPFEIHVNPPSADQEFKAVGFADVSKGSALLPTNQFSLGKILNKLNQLLKKLFASVLFWISSVSILLVRAALAYYLWKGFKDRLERDPAFARRIKAVKEAKQALSPARDYVMLGHSKELYALLSKVLRDFLANKWHQSSAALSVDTIVKNLKAAKIDDAHITEIKKILEQADLVCFAGATRDTAQMKTDLAQTEDLINYLQMHLK